MSNITFDSNVPQTAIDKLAYLFKSQSNNKKFMTALFGPSQDIEIVLKDLSTKRWITTGEGIQLDKLGTIIGQDRKGMSDARYRLALFTKIAENNSKGQFGDCVSIFKLLTGGTIVHVIEAYPASVSFVTNKNINGLSQADILAAMQSIVSAGVQVYAITFLPTWLCVLSGAIYAIDSDSTGQNMVAGIYNGRFYTSSDYGMTWTERQPAGNVDKLWYSVDTNSAGNKIIIANFERLYTSIDFGVTWIETQPAGNIDKLWATVASDYIGNNLIAGVFGGRIYISNNFGNTWTEMQPAGDFDANWVSIASDSTGQNLIAAINGGHIYLSHDFGATWIEKIFGSLSLNWSKVVSDSTGQNLMALENGYRIYLSHDFGVTWTETQPVGDSDKTWYGAASDSSGKNLIAEVFGGRVYKSSNFGSAWSEIQPTGNVDHNWISSAMNSDGNSIMISDDTNLYIYNDKIIAKPFAFEGSPIGLGYDEGQFV